MVWGIWAGLLFSGGFFSFLGWHQVLILLLLFLFFFFSTPWIYWRGVVIPHIVPIFLGLVFLCFALFLLGFFVNAGGKIPRYLRV